jgi:hypothetical protein
MMSFQTLQQIEILKINKKKDFYYKTAVNNLERSLWGVVIKECISRTLVNILDMPEKWHKCSTLYCQHITSYHIFVRKNLLFLRPGLYASYTRTPIYLKNSINFK